MKKRFWRNSMLMLVAMIGLCNHVFGASNASITISSTGTPVSAPGSITVAFSDSTGNIYSETVPYGQYSTPASLAAWLGAKFTSSYICVSAGNCNSGLGAKANGSGITFQLNNGASFGSPTITNPSASFSFNLSSWPPPVPVITWTTPAVITYGTALSATQLDASASVSGSFAYSPALGTVETAGTHTLTVIFTPTDTAAYSTATASVTLTVSQATPVITWLTPATIPPGTALSATQLDATANVPGTFVYSPAAGAVLAGGSQTLSATFTPTDTTDYSTIASSVPLLVSIAPGAGIITTAAGNGTYGYRGDSGPATSAELSYPGGVAVDSSGNIYIADPNNSRVRVVYESASGVYLNNLLSKLSISNPVVGDIYTIAGTGAFGYSGNGGLATSAKLNAPGSVVVDSSGNVYICDSGNLVIRKVTNNGIITTVSGLGTQYAVSASLAVDTAGNVYFADGTISVWKLTVSTGAVTRVAGYSTEWYSGDGGPATSAQLAYPGGVAVDSSGNIYIADTENSRIRVVYESASGVYLNNLLANLNITNPVVGDIYTIAGIGAVTSSGIIGAGYSGDGGLATIAKLWYPGGVAVDSSGNVYIGDIGNYRIRKVTASNGFITTVAGGGAEGGGGCPQQTDYVGDGCQAISADINQAGGVAVDSFGNFYIADSLNYRVRVVGGGGVPTPTFSPASGTYTTVQSVTISDSNPDATIYYTTNGTAPTTASSVYSSAIPVSITETLEAIATVTGQANSATASAAYVINLPAAATPTFSPVAGAYGPAQAVSISTTTPSATIYYTTDGSTPTTNSTQYTGAITVSATERLEAVAIAPNYSLSGVGVAAYTINGTAAMPIFDPPAGTYGSAQKVTIFSDTALGATIYYTTNGTTPTTSSSVYTGPITVSATETLKALAVASGYSNSAVASATYTLDGAVATPTFTPVAGAYGAAQTVTISDATPNATIYYTTDGSTPTDASSIYSSAITISATETLKALAIASDHSNSVVAWAAYTINLPLQITTSSLPNGAVGQWYSATLTATGGTESYTWSIASGSLPGGLSLNASTGEISGIPTGAAGPINLTVKVDRQ